MEQRLLCLSMIVKNEAASIRKVLEHCKGVIDYAVIVDTGSTDGTQKLAQEALEDFAIEGRIVHEPFVDFATTRNFALSLSEKEARFSLILSGDEYLQDGYLIRPILEKTEGLFDIYCMRTLLVHQQSENAIVRVFRTGGGAYYQGAIHEVAVGYEKAGYLPVTVLYDDSWALDEEKVRVRYDRDIAMIENAMARGEYQDKMLTYLLGYLVSDGKYQQAVDTIERYPGVVPDYAKVSIMMAYLHLGREAEAYQTLTEIAKNAKVAKEPLYMYALHLWKTERFSEAMEMAILCARIPVYPLGQQGSRDVGVTTWKPHWLIASCAQVLGKHDITIEAAQQAAIQAKYDPKVMELLSDIVDIKTPETATASAAN